MIPLDTARTLTIYGRPEVIEAADITRRQYDHWTPIRWTLHTGQRGPGPGYQMAHTVRDVHEYAIMRVLSRDAGMSVPDAAQLAAEIAVHDGGGVVPLPSSSPYLTTEIYPSAIRLDVDRRLADIPPRDAFDGQWVTLDQLRKDV